MTSTTGVDTDVVIVGYGPVGQVLASLLARDGHRVVVCERHLGPYPTPRAGHFDHEIMRIFQSIGAADAIQAVAEPARVYQFLDREARVVSSLPRGGIAPSGWSSSYHMYQPEIEQILDQTARQSGNVEVLRGYTVDCLAQTPTSATVTTTCDTTGDQKVITARFVVGCDGANSTVRSMLDVQETDLGFAADWLVVDVRVRDDQHVPDIPDTAQICDPARPSFMARLRGPYLRWEFMIVPGDDPTQMTSDDTVWRLLSPWLSPEQAELIRCTVYQFRSMLAHDYRVGRVLLAGDSAHRMPPTLGQGMCSGIRDAATLAWLLDLVLRDVSRDGLLDEYQPVRRPHVADYITEAVHIGAIVCETDPVRAEANLRAMASGPPTRAAFQPSIVSGVRTEDALAGTLSVQPRIQDGADGLIRLDDRVGPGFQLITTGSDFDATDLVGARASRLRIRHVHLIDDDTVADHPGRGPAVVEENGSVSNWLAAAGVQAVVVRPDYYVYGSANSRTELADLLDDLCEYLRLIPDRRIEYLP